MKNHRIAGQWGFTLIELVVVIAILRVLGAISIPLITNYLTQAREWAYHSDVKVVQAAVDGYFRASNHDADGTSDNENFNGQRQYPIYGKNKASNPKWVDTTTTTTTTDDGIRDSAGDNAEDGLLDTGESGTSGWYLVSVIQQ